MGLQSILAGYGFTPGHRAPGWKRAERRLLVGTIKSFVVSQEDDGPRVNAEMQTHEGEALTLYHTAHLAYAYCNVAKVDWHDAINADYFSHIIGWTFVIHYLGQDPKKKDAHTYDIQATASPEYTLEDLYNLVAGALSPEELAPIVLDAGEDSDL